MPNKITRQIMYQYELNKRIMEKQIEQELFKLGLKKRKLKDERYVKFWLNKHKILFLEEQDGDYINYTLIKGNRAIQRWRFETVEKAIRRTGDDLVEGLD